MAEVKRTQEAAIATPTSARLTRIMSSSSHEPLVSEKLVHDMQQHIARAAESLPPLHCFGRERKGTPQSLTAAPPARKAAPAGTLARRTTPTSGGMGVPVERAFLRGGARDQPTLPSSRAFSTLDKGFEQRAMARANSGAGAREHVGSRGTLGSSKPMHMPGSSTDSAACGERAAWCAARPCW